MNGGTSANKTLPDKKLTFRKARLSDAAGLAACFDAAYSVYNSYIDDLPDVSEGVADDIARNIVWVAVCGVDVVAGMVLVAMPDHLHLANIAVVPSCTGKGLGKALTEIATRECLAQGLANISLATHQKMPENVEFYRHLGWRVTGRSLNKTHMNKIINR